MNKHLPALLLAALALPVLAAPPQVKIQSFTAKYCPKPSPDPECSEFIVSRPVFPDAVQNAFVEKLLRPMSAADGLKTLTKAAALRELKKRVNENRDDEGYPRHQYIVEADLEGYTPHYYVLSTTDYEFSGGAHGAGDGSDYVIPRSGKPVPLKLADILLPGKKAAFAALHREGMTNYYLEEGVGKTRQEIEADYDNKDSSHYLTDEHLENWTFYKNALSYTYNHYTFGSYVDTPSFLLPADKLKGIAKPEILRELEAYREWKR